MSLPVRAVSTGFATPLTGPFFKARSSDESQLATRLGVMEFVREYLSISVVEYAFCQERLQLANSRLGLSIDALDEECWSTVFRPGADT
jgi:hypothetical protein